ncbi:MAG: MATE family efflux transporter, partial [Oscillospiraceae bacterium]
NIIDAIIVGNYVGQNALAAVTSTGSLIFLLVGFFGGMSSGAGVVISRYFGAGEKEEVEKSVGTAVVFGLVSGIILTVIGTLLTPYILQLMGTPQDVFVDATDYVRTYVMGVVFLSLYNTASGIFQAVGDSKRPLYYLIVSSFVNIVLDLVFVRVFDMGVKGVAIATIIAQAVSAVLAFIRLSTIKEVYRVNFKKLKFDYNKLVQILKIGIPSGIQNSVIGLANVVVQSSINSFGAAAMAGCGAYSKIEGFAFIPINAFTMAITTFVSQNLGAKNEERVKKGARFGIIFSCVVAQAIGIIFMLFASPLISIFGKDAESIAYGISKTYVDAPFYFLLSFSHCVASVLRGAGKSSVPMTVMLSCWCVIRVLYINIGTSILHEIAVVNWAYPLTWFLSSVIFLIYYKKSNWLKKSLQ